MSVEQKKHECLKDNNVWRLPYKVSAPCLDYVYTKGCGYPLVRFTKTTFLGYPRWGYKAQCEGNNGWVWELMGTNSYCVQTEYNTKQKCLYSGGTWIGGYSDGSEKNKQECEDKKVKNPNRKLPQGVFSMPCAVWPSGVPAYDMCRLTMTVDSCCAQHSSEDEKYWDWVSVAGLAQGTAQQYLNPGTNLSLDLRYTF